MKTINGKSLMTTAPWSRRRAGRRGLRRLAAMMLVVGVASAGCGGSDESDESGDKASGSELGEIQLGLPGGKTDVTLPVELGLELGIFEKHGVKLDVVPVQDPAAVGAAVAGGSLDASVAGLPPVAASVLEDGELRFFCGTHSSTPQMIIAPADSSLPTIEETGGDWEAVLEALAGKKVGDYGPSASPSAVFHAVMESAGVSEDEVDYIPVGAGPAAVAAMERGDVDAELTFPFTGEQLVDSGTAKILIHLNDHVPMYKEWPFGFMARASWIKDNPELATAFCEAWGESIAAVTDPANEEATLELLSSPGYDLKTEVGQALALDSVKSSMSNEIPEKGIDMALEFSQSHGLLPDEPALTYDDVVQLPEGTD